MANKNIQMVAVDGSSAPVKLIDNGDSSFSPQVALAGGASLTVSQAGAANFRTGQVALSTAASAVKTLTATRRNITVRNLDSSISIYIGTDNTVTSGNGMLLKAGESIDINSVAAVWAIAASGTPSVSYLEAYD